MATASPLEADLFFDFAFDLLAVVGGDGYFKRINPAFRRALGYTEYELMSQPLSRFLHPEDVEKTELGIRKLLAGNVRVDSVNRYLCKNGEYRWFSWNTVPKDRLMYTVGRDITEQRAMQEEIRELNAQLERRNIDLETSVQERMKELAESESQLRHLQKMDAVGTLAGGIAHDFNNILEAIALYCDYLPGIADRPETVRETAEEIRAATARAAAITRQLLIFTRQQVGSLAHVEVHPLILAMEKMLNRLIGDKYAIELELDAVPLAARSDSSQLEQVLMNLVLNARDAMPDGGKIHIATKAVRFNEPFTGTHLGAPAGDYVQLTVSDGGCGMGAATLAKIFDPFYTTKPVGRGTGMGLSTVYGIVKQSGGAITVESRPDMGSIFKIYLPVSRGENLQTGRPPAVSHAPVRDITILLVEDDEQLREIFTLMLEQNHVRTLTAEGPVQAMELLKTHAGGIDLLLTDFAMARMNGLELARLARTIRPSLRVLFMSGFLRGTSDSSALEELKPQEFIQKPFDTKTLLAKIGGMMAMAAATNG